MSRQQTFSITVRGKVQGVYYRQSTREAALKLGLTGEVRNQPDGSVLIIATGDKLSLDQLIQWCRLGPARAKVEEVVAEEIPARLFTDFSITRF